MPTCAECGAPIPKSYRKFCSKECRAAWGHSVAKDVAKARRAAGLCRYCGGKADSGKLTCGACREEYRMRVVRRIEVRRGQGSCIRCGRAPRPGYRQCELCLAYSDAWRRRRRGERG